MLRRLRQMLLRKAEAKIGVSNWCAISYNSGLGHFVAGNQLEIEQCQFFWVRCVESLWKLAQDGGKSGSLVRRMATNFNRNISEC